MVAEEIREALARKRWSIAKAAKECGVERKFLSRLVKGLPPPRAKKGRQIAEADPRYRQIAEALSLPCEEFIETVMKAQGDAALPEVLPERQLHFLAHVWRSPLKDLVPSEYKKEISQLLVEYVKAAAKNGGIRVQRRRIAKSFEPNPIPLSDSPPSMVPRLEGSQGGELGLTGQSERPRHERGRLSELLEHVGDEIYSVQGKDAIDSQFEIAQLFFDLSRRALSGPEDLKRAVDLAQAPLSQG